MGAVAEGTEEDTVVDMAETVVTLLALAPNHNQDEVRWDGQGVLTNASVTVSARRDTAGTEMAVGFPIQMR